MGESDAARPGRGALYWIGVVLTFVLAAAVGIAGLQQWSVVEGRAWAERDAPLALGSPRARILEAHPVAPMELKDDDPADEALWSFVLEGQGDCGDPTDDWQVFARRQLERGNTLLVYRTGFPAGRSYVYVLGEDDLLACRVVAAG